jgi:hypothetical protein
MVHAHPSQPSSEKHIRAILGDLVAQRRLLRQSPVDPAVVAANGASIAYWQSKLRRSAAGQRPPTS